MALAAILLILMGTIGSIDLLYYHLYKFRLYDQPSARGEEVTHLVRAATFAFGLWILLHYTPQGGWFWIMAALFGVEFVDDVCDVAIEPKSREPLGGLPPLEYLVHMVASLCTGGVWVAFLTAGWAGRNAASALVPHAAGFLPTWLHLDGLAMIFAGVALGLVELTLFVRSLVRRGGGGAAPEPVTT